MTSCIRLDDFPDQEQEKDLFLPLLFNTGQVLTRTIKQENQSPRLKKREKENSPLFRDDMILYTESQEKATKI